MRKLSLLSSLTILTFAAFAGSERGSAEEPVAGQGPDKAVELVAATSAQDYRLITLSNRDVFESRTEVPVCGPYNGGDLWLAIPVPKEGTISVRGGSSDFGLTRMEAYTGVPGALDHLACAMPDELNQVPDLQLTDLRPGETVYLRIWDAGNDEIGVFSLAVYVPGTSASEVANGVLPVVDITPPTVEVENTDDIMTRIAARMQVYPNPVYMVDPVAYVRLSAAFAPESRVKLTLFDFSGEPVRELRTYVDEEIPFPVNGIRGGVYVLTAVGRSSTASAQVIIR